MLGIVNIRWLVLAISLDLLIFMELVVPVSNHAPNIWEFIHTSLPLPCRHAHNWHIGLTNQSLLGLETHPDANFHEHVTVKQKLSRFHTKCPAQVLCYLALRYLWPCDLFLMVWHGSFDTVCWRLKHTTLPPTFQILLLWFLLHLHHHSGVFPSICSVVFSPLQPAVVVDISSIAYSKHSTLILPPFWPPPFMSSYNPIHTCMYSGITATTIPLSRDRWLDDWTQSQSQFMIYSYHPDLFQHLWTDHPLWLI